MPKPVAKTPIKVKVSIVPGKGTPAQLRQFRAAFARLLAQAKSESKNA